MGSQQSCGTQQISNCKRPLPLYKDPSQLGICCEGPSYADNGTQILTEPTTYPFDFSENATQIIKNKRVAEELPNKYLGKNLHCQILFQNILKCELENNFKLNLALKRQFKICPQEKFDIASLIKLNKKYRIVYEHNTNPSLCYIIENKFKKVLPFLNKAENLHDYIFIDLKNVEGSIWENKEPQLYCKIGRGFFKDWYICTYKLSIKIVESIDYNDANLDATPYLNCDNVNCECENLIRIEVKK